MHMWKLIRDGESSFITRVLFQLRCIVPVVGKFTCITAKTPFRICSRNSIIYFMTIEKDLHTTRRRWALFITQINKMSIWTVLQQNKCGFLGILWNSCIHFYNCWVMQDQRVIQIDLIFRCNTAAFTSFWFILNLPSNFWFKRQQIPKVNVSRIILVYDDDPKMGFTDDKYNRRT